MSILKLLLALAIITFDLLTALTAFAEFAPRELLVKTATQPVRGLDQSITSTGVAGIDREVESGRVAIATPYQSFNRRFPQVNSILHLQWTDVVNLDSLEQIISADPRVIWVAHNNIYRPNSLDEIPDDSLREDQYWLDLVHAPEAWDITQGDSAIILGIIDTGIDYLHRDLAPNTWHNPGEIDSNGIDDDQNGFVDDMIGWDFVDAPAFPSPGDNLVRDNDPMDEMGHGTYVAGVAAAATNNRFCFSSIGYNTSIMCLRAGNADGLLEEDDIAAAILYAADNGARVLNMSFGDVVVSPLLREAVQIANDAGVIQVASAGNANSRSIHYPSGFTEVISVGATDQLDRRAPFSNYGPSVDLFAPGYDIHSTILGGECGLWDFPHGTSYAAPMIAATAALCLSVNPNLDQNAMTDILRSTADDLRDEGWDSTTAHGRLNVRRAVEQAAFGSDVVARITYPPTDLGLVSDLMVTGSAWGAAFNHYELSYGLGENPRRWIAVASSNSRVFEGNLGQFQLPAFDTVLVIRLETVGNSGQAALEHRHVYIQRDLPVIDSFKVTRMLNAESYGDLVQVWANQVTTASFLLNRIGEVDPLRHDFGYVSDTHAGLLSQADHSGRWMVTIELINQAGLRSQSAPFDYEITESSFNTNLWSRSVTNAPRGYFGAFSSSFDNDNQPELWLWPIGPEGVTFDPLAPYEWTGTTFEITGNTYADHIPQDIGDADNDGLIEMMGRNGPKTRIWEPLQAGQFPNSVVFEAEFNTIGAGFYEFAADDPGEEAVFRKNTSPDSFATPLFVVYGVSSSYQLTPYDTIPNETEGANNLGSPRLVAGDFDRDGLTDVFYGDYDGDVIFCEQVAGRFQQKWSTRLPLNDATAWLDAGQLDQDENFELVAGCRSNSGGGTESQRRARHWEYFVFDITGDDQFVLSDSIYVLGNDNVSTYPASVECANIDDDSAEELLISAFPDLYIVEYKPETGRYAPSWYYYPCMSNTFLISDWDQNGLNEFYFSDGEHIVRAEASGSTGQRPLPPATLSHEPLSATSIRLDWSRVAGAESYSIYRASQIPEFTYLRDVTDTTAVLTDVPTDSVFHYAVTAIDFNTPVQESAYSPFVAAIASAAPTSEDTAVFIPPHFVAIRFSEPMGPTAFQQWNYRLNGTTFPEVVLSGDGEGTTYLSFSGELPEGSHTISMSGLRDAQYFLLPSPEQSVTFDVEHTITNQPHVTTHQSMGGALITALEITFSDSMSESVLNVANYRMDTPYRVTAVTAQNGARSLVRCEFDTRYPVGALGKTARLQIRNVFDQSGNPIDTASADILIGNPAANLDEAYVYPNPYAGRGADGLEQVMFAALPTKAKIRLFDLRGALVREIDHDNSVGGTPWNLKNSEGDRVASGVYVFTIEANGETVRGKLAVLR